MPQVMVEAFAKGLIDKIMVEAFNVMDTNNGKFCYTRTIRLNTITFNNYLDNQFENCLCTGYFLTPFLTA